MEPTAIRRGRFSQMRIFSATATHLWRFSTVTRVKSLFVFGRLTNSCCVMGGFCDAGHGCNRQFNQLTKKHGRLVRFTIAVCPSWAGRITSVE